MSIEARCFWAGLACLTVAIILTWVFADRIFLPHRIPVGNELISVDVHDANTPVEVTP